MLSTSMVLNKEYKILVKYIVFKMSCRVVQGKGKKMQQVWGDMDAVGRSNHKCKMKKKKYIYIYRHIAAYSLK